MRKRPWLAVGLLCAGLLAGCQTPAKPSTPAVHRDFTDEVDRGYFQLLGATPVDITLDGGRTLRGCTYLGYTNFREKDYLHVKDWLGSDYMIPTGHITSIKR